MNESESAAVIATLNEILEIELAGVVRYSHYSLMIFGHARIPIVSWMRAQATEGTRPRRWPPVSTSPRSAATPRWGSASCSRPTSTTSIRSCGRRWSTSCSGIAAYRKLLKQTEGKSVVLEEYARKMVHGEETHVMDIEKMLRRPGKLEPAR